jgi:hypothetical protein
MKNLKLIAILFITCGILAVIFTLNGCTKKDQTQTTGDNKQQTDPNNKDVQKTDPTKTDPTKTDPTKTDPTKNELGIKEGLPDDYPKDIPQPKGGKVLGSLNTSEGTTVTFESSEKPADISKDFTDVIEKGGFKKAEGDMMKEEGGMIMWKKDPREVSLMLAWDKDKKISSIVVTYK